jgi:hypothetical protein
MGMFPSVLLLGTGPLPCIGRRSQTDNRDLPEKLWANCPLAESDHDVPRKVEASAEWYGNR